MIDSLLIFSRTGGEPHRTRESILLLLEKAVALVRAHPDVEGVRISVRCNQTAEETEVMLDPKKMERAIYNLLLNACQSARRSGEKREVNASVVVNDGEITVDIADTGPGCQSRFGKPL